LRTDEHLYAIFREEPRWLFLLAGRPDPGECEFRSEQFKSLNRTCDGLIEPLDASLPLTIVEFQLSAGDDPYLRIVQEMTLAQEAHPGREVDGVIFFGKRVRDPQTQPWARVVVVQRFEEAIQRFSEACPDHPLTHLMYPIVEERDDALEREGTHHYHALLEQQARGELKTDLSAVFLKLFCQRFLNKTPEEIDMILLEDLPEFETTAAAREMLRRGSVRTCLAGARAKFLNLETKVEGAIQQLTADEAEALIQALMPMSSVRELNDWLDSLPSRASS